ncbi:hypothetical protein [Actinoplanes sp. DH11]|uniref:hypothetical protein n=1 Tax=Actinoplanes sp. DH11 TaxID=2857011 RepID=UPI001E31E8C9|nr:hypothetical protein [Actinoplanes sp. DH11]
MTTLESCYRRLLRVFPAGHRAAYEEEMIGVLMSGSAPGRRFPSPADAADLLRSGLAVRLGRARSSPGRAEWRDAAAVTGLIVAAMMAAVAGARLLAGVRVHLFDSPAEPMEMFGIRGLLLLDVGLRFAFWAAVCLAALLGLRRTAAWLSGAAALVELGAVLWWLPHTPFQSSLRLTWSVVTVGVVVAAFVLARRGRPLPVLLGRRGVGAFAAVAAVLLCVRVAAEGAFAPGHRLPVRLVELALFILVAATVLAVAPGVRDRAAALLVPALIGPVTWEMAQSEGLLSMLGAGVAPYWAVIVVLVSPILAFGAALTVLWAWRVSRSAAEAKEQGHE